jgi:hypothetical protein
MEAKADSSIQKAYDAYIATLPPKTGPCHLEEFEAIYRLHDTEVQQLKDQIAPALRDDYQSGEAGESQPQTRNRCN